MVFNLSEGNSIANQLMSECRDKRINDNFCYVAGLGDAGDFCLGEQL